MAPGKISVTLLVLIYWTIMLGEMNPGVQVNAKACPLFCLRVAYMTCPATGSKHLRGSCNCCFAPDGCTLHISGGQKLKCP